MRRLLLLLFLLLLLLLPTVLYIYISPRTVLLWLLFLLWYYYGIINIILYCPHTQHHTRACYLLPAAGTRASRPALPPGGGRGAPGGPVHGRSGSMSGPGGLRELLGESPVAGAQAAAGPSRGPPSHPARAAILTSPPPPQPLMAGSVSHSKVWGGAQSPSKVGGEVGCSSP